MENYKQNMCNAFENLQFSNTNFLEIKKHLMTSEKGLKKQDWLSKPFFPEDSMLGRLAETAYQDNISSLPSGWKLLTIARSKSDGYFGAAYVNINENQLVIAHRGTKLNSLSALLTDIEGIVYNQFTSQMESACSFVAYILLELNLETTSVSFTGHSLGGWLAQVTTFSTEYLTMNKKGFRGKSDQSIKCHPHTVVFDSPGCHEMLVKLSENYYPRYQHKSQYFINSLDITTYLSAPNLINTCNRHVGTLYRVYPVLPDWGLNWNSFLKKLTGKTQEAFYYTLQNHGLKGILSALGGQKREVLDWPLVTWPPGTAEKSDVNGFWLMKAIKLFKATPSLIFDKLFKLKNNEYKQFFEFANKVNNYNPEEKLILGDIVLHYKVILPHKNDRIIAIFSQNELVFLESWLLFKNIKTNSREIHSFLSANKLEKYVDVLNSFSIIVKQGEKRISCKPGTLNSVVNCIKKLFSHYPLDMKKIMNQMVGIPEVFGALLQSKTKDYLFFNKLSLEFKDTIGLQKYLESIYHNILYISSEDSTLEVTRIYSALMKLEDGVFDKFTNEKHFSFFSWSQILSFENIVELSSVINCQSNFSNLIVLDCQDVEMSVDDIKLLSSLLESLNNAIKKTIIIADKNDCTIKNSLLNLKYIEYESKELVWGDLTIDTQKELSMKNLVIFQNENKKISLNEVIGIVKEDKDTLKKLIEVINSETVLKLINNKIINIGRAPLYLSNLDKSYTQFYEEIPPQNCINFLLRFADHSTHPILIISGLGQIEPDLAKKKICNILGLENTNDQVIKKQYIEQIDFINSNYICTSKIILIGPNEFQNGDFQEFCHNNPKRVVYWIKFNDHKLILQQLYDPNLYINRNFKCFSKLVIKKYLKDELIKTDLTINYIFSNTDQDNLIEILGGFSSDKKIHFINNMANTKILCFGLEEEARNYFLKLRGDAPVHWISIEKNKLVWKCSHGSLKPISQFVDAEQSEKVLLKEEDFLENVKGNKTVIIVGDPGIGKSTTLLKVSEIMQSACWIIQINLKHCLNAIEQLPSCKMTVDHAVNFIQITDLQSDKSLEKSIIKYKIEHGSNSKPLLLLFDGFDEIKDKNGKRKIILLLQFLKDKVSMWINSRKHDHEQLQNSLIVFKTQLIEFTPEEQKVYLQQFWKGQFILSWDSNKFTECFQTYYQEGKTKFDVFTDSLFKQVNKIMGETDSHFIKIPLQLRLLAEGFKNEFSKFVSNGYSELDFSTLSLLGLYKQFVDAKFNIYLKEKLILTLVNSVSEEWFKEPLKKRHLRLSLIKLFGDYGGGLVGKKPPLRFSSNSSSFSIYQQELEELFCVGLIHVTQNNSFDFLHQTISEYFSSEYLVHLLKKPLGNRRSSKAVEFLLTVILVSSEHKLIHLFINDSLNNCSEQISDEVLKSYGEEIKRLWCEKHHKFLNEYNQTALHVVSKSNYSNILNFLLSSLKTSSAFEECIDFISARTMNGETALYEALKHNYDFIIKLFLSNMEACSETAIETFFLATSFRTIMDKNSLIMKRLLEFLEKYPRLKTIFQDLHNKWHQESFLQGVKEGNIDYMGTILNDISQKLNKYMLLMVDNDGNSVLHITAMRCKWIAFEFLVKKFSDEDLFYIMRTKNDADQTVMHAIIENKKIRDVNLKFLGPVLNEIINRIPEKHRPGVINAKNNDGMTILHLAAEDDKWDVVMSFINALHKEHQSEVINIKNNYGWGIVRLAGQKADLNTLKELIEKDADILDLSTVSILHEVVCNDDKDVLKFILRKLYEKLDGNSEQIYCYVNAKDSKGDTPLMWSAERGNIDAVKELLSVNEINVNTQNSGGKTALDWANKNQHKDIVKIIQAYIERKEGIHSVTNETENDINIHRSSTNLFAQNNTESKIIPENMHKGNALGGGDCFYDSVAQCINQMLGLEVTVKSLRKTCHTFALKELNNHESWLKDVLKLDNGEITEIYEYACRIQYSNEDIKTNIEEINVLGLTHPIWGRPYIEGRIICEHYNIKLHVLELLITKLNVVPVHILVDQTGTKTMEVDYSESRLIHILNEGDFHFIPLLFKIKDVPFVEEFDESQNNFFLKIKNSLWKLEQISETIQEFDSNKFDEEITPLPPALVETMEFLGLKGSLPIGKIDLSDNQLRKLNKINKIGDNRLLEAARSGEEEVINLLICCGMDVNYESSKTNQKAVDLAWEYGHYEVMLSLLKADSEYPKDFNLPDLYNDESIPDKLKLFIKGREDLVNVWINNDNLQNIKQIVLKYQSPIFSFSKFLNSKNCSALEAAARYGSVSAISILLGLKSVDFTEKDVNLTKEQVLLLNNEVNRNGDTLTSVAAENGRKGNVKFLVACGVDVNHENKAGNVPIDLAWANSHYSVVLLLLKADSEFPKGFSLDHLSDVGTQMQLKHFVLHRMKLHALIEGGDLEGVKMSISQDIKSKYYLSTQGHSAALTALIKNEYGIFAFLKSTGVDLKNDLERSSIDYRFSEHQKDSLKKAMIPYFPSFETAHLYYLISKSRSQKHMDDFVFKIRSYFKQLDVVPEVSKILQVVQYADYLDIVFDFDNENIKDINPTASEFTKGTTDYKEGRLYIAAKMEETKILGTLAHELSHLAMEMVYKNDCIPYKRTDNLSASKFKRITEYFRNNDNIKNSGTSGSDSPMKIVARAFRYPEEEQESELIVRVPHIYSQYHEIMDVKNWFCSEEDTYLKEILDYYHKEVMTSCDEFIKHSFFIKPRNIVKSLNESFGEISLLEEIKVSFNESIDLNSFLNNTYSQNILVLYANCTELVTLNIHETLKYMQIHESSLVFNFRNYLKHFQEIDKAFYSEACALLILECPFDSDNNQLFRELEKWFDLLKEKPNKKIIFVIHEQKQEDFEKNQSEQQLFFKPNRKFYNYSLNDLTTESQETVMNKIIKVQGKNIYLRDMLDENENCLKLVENKILMKLISDQKIEIGKEPQISSGYDGNYYMHRMFNRRIEIYEKIEKDNKNGKFEDKLVFNEDDFKKLILEEKGNIHWLERDGDKFIWKNSEGSISSLLNYKINIKDHRFDDKSIKAYLISEEELLNNFNQGKIVLISDTAGMGKTTVLTSLTLHLKYTKPKFWVIRINLNFYTNIFYEEMNKRKCKNTKTKGRKTADNNNEAIYSSSDGINFLLDKFLEIDELSSPESAFERRLLDYHLQLKCNIILLLDGFDEISPDYKDVVIELIKALQVHVEKIVITTRPHMSMELESTFGTFACTLNPLSELEQMEFLVKFWQKHNPKFTDKKRLEVYAKKLIGLFTYSINDKIKEFTGVPLQSRMIAEIFVEKLERPMILCELFKKKRKSFKLIEENLEDFYSSSKQEPLFCEKVSLLDLYDIFIYKKYCDIYETEKKNAVLSNLGTMTDIKKSYPKFIEEHTELAVFSRFSRNQCKFLLEEEGLEDVESLIDFVIQGDERRGLVDQVFGGKPIFVHQTFAEYFISEFLVSCLIKKHQDYKVIQFLLTNILVKPEHLVIRSFLNEHLLILEKNRFKRVLETYGNKMNDLWLKKPIMNDNGDTPLHLAASEENFEIAHFILSSIKDNKYKSTRTELIFFINKKGGVALHDAAEKGNISIIELLVQHGADVNSSFESSREHYGSTVLYLAAEGGHSEAVKFLADNGVSANACLKGNARYAGMTMLHLAAERGDLVVAKLLVQIGADIEIVVKGDIYEGLRALHIAAINGNWDLVKWLVTDCKADVNAVAGNGKYQGASIFPWATKESLEDLIFLKNYNANIDAGDENGNTALHLISGLIDYKTTASWLLENNANINSKNNSGETPLHTEINNNQELSVRNIKFLLSHGADIYELDKNGYSPLHTACFANYSNIIELLMDYIVNGG